MKGTNGRDSLSKMQKRLKNTKYDLPFSEALINLELQERHTNHRNSSHKKRLKQHPEAVDLAVGEQASGAVNELRGTFLTKNGRCPWKPPENLKIDETWTLSESKLFDLVDAAKSNGGPLASLFNKKTTSTSNCRVAPFFVDYVAAIVLYNEKAEDQEAPGIFV